MTKVIMQLIWKKVDSNYSQKQYEMAEKWCLLALKKAFVASGPVNKAKLERYEWKSSWLKWDLLTN